MSAAPAPRPLPLPLPAFPLRASAERPSLCWSPPHICPRSLYSCVPVRVVRQQYFPFAPLPPPLLPCLSVAVYSARRLHSVIYSAPASLSRQREDMCVAGACGMVVGSCRSRWLSSRGCACVLMLLAGTCWCCRACVWVRVAGASCCGSLVGFGRCSGVLAAFPALSCVCVFVCVLLWLCSGISSSLVVWLQV